MNQVIDKKEEEKIMAQLEQLENNISNVSFLQIAQYSNLYLDSLIKRFSELYQEHAGVEFKLASKNELQDLSLYAYDGINKKAHDIAKNDYLILFLKRNLYIMQGIIEQKIEEQVSEAQEVLHHYYNLDTDYDIRINTNKLFLSKEVGKYNYFDSHTNVLVTIYKAKNGVSLAESDSVEISSTDELDKAFKKLVALNKHIHPKQ